MPLNESKKLIDVALQTWVDNWTWLVTQEGAWEIQLFGEAVDKLTLALGEEPPVEVFGKVEEGRNAAGDVDWSGTVFIFGAHRFAILTKNISARPEVRVFARTSVHSVEVTGGRIRDSSITPSVSFLAHYPDIDVAYLPLRSRTGSDRAAFLESVLQDLSSYGA